ncbi:Protease inhibitor precursor [compost metagenome]
MITLRIKGTAISDSSQDEVVLRITEDTSIIHVDGSEATMDELSKDAEIIAFYSPLLTRSLPPIGTAGKLILLNME